MIRIILCDDHTIITDGISDLLSCEDDIEIVAVCHNGQEVMDTLIKSDPDILLLDIDMPVMNGFECAEAVLKKDPRVKIAMLTMHDEKALIKRFIEIGVKGYFLKTIGKEELLRALRRIAEGEDYFPSDVTKALLREKALSPNITKDPLLTELSERETEIIRYVAKGKSNKEIAEDLYISPRTVDTHRSNIMRKLDVHNVAGIIRFAFVNGLVD
jgi:two-component system response regulator NreC